MAENKAVVDTPPEPKSAELENGENGEKPVATHGNVSALHEYAESEGYVIDGEGGQSGFKLAKDGRTRLIPQPSGAHHDPVDWSRGVKHLMRFIGAVAA